MNIFIVLNNFTPIGTAPISDVSAAAPAVAEAGNLRSECNNPGAAPLLEKAPLFLVLPDTAALKDGKPFFIPEHAAPCSLRASLVVRISRLGRSIPERFAHRYYDALTLGVTFAAENVLAEKRRLGLPWSEAVGFDGSACFGRFLPLGDGLTLDAATFELQAGGAPIQRSTPAAPRFSIDAVVSHISQFHILRQGDLIFLGCPCRAEEAHQDVRLTGSINGTEVLSFNVK